MATCENPKCPLPDREFLPAYRGAPFCSATCRREQKLAARSQPKKRTVVQLSKRKDPRFVSGDLVCQAPWCTRSMAHDHHVIYEQHVARMGGDVGDPTNALGVCFDDHGTHHKQIKKLPISCLHDRNLDFAYKLLGLSASDYLHRHYAGDDPRLDKLETMVKCGVLL